MNGNENQVYERDLKSILYIIDGFEFGGGERVFLQLASILRNDYKVIVASTGCGRFEREIRDLGVDFHSIDFNKRISWNTIKSIKDIIQKNEVQIIHSQGARVDLLSRIAGKWAKVPKIVCTIAMPVEGFDVKIVRKFFYRLADRISERYVDAFLVVSNTLYRLLTESRGISSQKVIRVYNGIEVDQYTAKEKNSGLLKEWGIPTMAKVVGSVGRLVWQKGYKYLIKAMPKVLERFPETRLIVVGEGPLKKELEMMARELKIDEMVIFTGAREDINEVLSCFDLFVIPSVNEGFPIVTLEAMAMSKPIIATRINGITEQIIDGKTGILVPSHHPELLTKAILQLIQDRELSEKLGMAARIAVEREFSIEKMIENTEKVYLELLGRTQ